MKKSRQKSRTKPQIWETFLKVKFPADLPPDADDAWLVAKGIDPIAPAMLRHVRYDVLPLVRQLERRGLDWFSFLLHDGASGVPTTPDDKNLYIHLRLKRMGQEPRAALGFYIPNPWVMTRRVELSDEIGGIDRSVLVGEDIMPAWSMIAEQSALFLKIIELYKPETDNLTLLKQVRQFLHYLANMSQMRCL